MIELTEAPLNPTALLERARSTKAGGLCLFLGTVRDLTGDRATASLDYEAHPEMARRKMAELDETARRRWPLLAVEIAHRLGHLEPGEIAVVVVVASAHRGDAFEACRWIIDTFKQVVPIWKRENWADGSSEWVHPGQDNPPIPPPPPSPPTSASPPTLSPSPTAVSQVDHL
ncbi:molybdopterin synthase subunit MoaE [Isosphaera pallida ATCC 43644]|uniref:Molybdopterin synthase catalytic subunit n=1 Tax=Isosphaera pallida (strain ATCC 43644 / DSM 9630 / IS1B) TaxID=575540 RepID=E8R2S3_ISOPI|nr:molybdenum cofactor biosynthesis protein MoaE [Isosphaera pallida]ADV63570.1 molybdopterin synthase subunit MoaE [Isosphaera pallida ATCC 43644]